MALIIYQFTSQAQQQEDSSIVQTLQLSDGVEGNMYQILFLIQSSSDKRNLQLLIDTIVNNYSTLLPDYKMLEIPYDERISMLISVLEHRVSIFVHAIDKEDKGYSFGYEVPMQLRRPLIEIKRNQTNK